jgi:hypothetical protein
MKGKVVSAVPPAQTANHVVRDFDNSAEMARITGQPVLAGKHVVYTRVNSIRMYTRPPYVTDEGRIAVKFRNSKIEDDGKRYGDLYFEWVPTETTATPTQEEN